LRTHPLAPSILPLLEAPAEDFVWNLPEFGRRIRFDVLHVCETRPLVAHFQSREEPKVTRSEIRRLRWLGDDRNAFLGEELLHNKRCVARCIIVMQKPLSLPLVAPFPPKCIEQPLQNLHVEMTAVLSGSRSEWLLVVPYSENGPQGDAFRNHGGHQIECDGRTPEDSKRSLPPVLPTMAGSMEQLCVCAQGSYFEGN